MTQRPYDPADQYDLLTNYVHSLRIARDWAAATGNGAHLDALSDLLDAADTQLADCEALLTVDYVLDACP